MSNFSIERPLHDERVEPGAPFELYYMRPIEDYALQESFRQVAVPALRKVIENRKLLFDPETFRVRFREHPKFGPVWEASVEVRERPKVV